MLKRKYKFIHATPANKDFLEENVDLYVTNVFQYQSRAEVFTRKVKILGTSSNRDI